QHLGHVKSVDHAPTHNLQDQISHKIAVLDALRERHPPRTRFIIVGHSIGAYIALQVLRARPAHGIVKLYALFPELHSIAATPNGRTLQTHKDKLVMYYGRTDSWCPLDHHETMKSLVPDAEIYLCDRGLQHAFVLGGSEKMGEIVSAWVRKLQQPEQSSPPEEIVW
ncbi:hypothetical protein BDK51DRAFT_28637, partial [Blyttiomyces helicus]